MTKQEMNQMSENVQITNDIMPEAARLENLTRRELKELEEKEKTPIQKAFEFIIMILPLICGVIAILEYLLIPDKTMNKNPMYYIYVLVIFMAAYFCYSCFAGYKRWRGNKIYYEKLRYRAPLFSALFLFLAIYDFCLLYTSPSPRD